MKIRKPHSLLLLAFLSILAGSILSGCASSSYPGSTSVSVGYGFGISDPYFYSGGYYSRPPVIVAPPPYRPPMGRPGRPTTLPGRL